MTAPLQAGTKRAEDRGATWDLEAYFRRIRYGGPREPTFEVLAAITRLHPRHIPFENLSPLLGLPVRLDAASLQDKLLRQRRGGYCFEQNLLLQGMLQSIGFQVTALAARVLWRRPPGPPAPRSHMLLRVDLDGAAYVVDVGFGGMTLNHPLRLDDPGEQATPLEPFRLLPGRGGYEMQALLPEGWSRVYSFDLQEQLLPDFELVSWYLCHHPESHFRANVFAARLDETGRHALFNNRLTRHEPGRPSQSRAIADEGELLEVLDRVFGIEVPAVPGVHERLRAAVRSAPG